MIAHISFSNEMKSEKERISLNGFIIFQYLCKRFGYYFMNSENKSLLWFTMLSYIDKGLAFVLPLSVLYIYKDKDTYNNLEYAYSIANIAVYLFSVGSMYAFYGYKEAKNKRNYVSDYLSISGLSIICVSIISLFIAIIQPEIGKEISFVVFLLISARIILLLFISFLSVYYRLIDKPSEILLYSITINIVILVLLFIFSFFELNLLYSFALPEFVIPLLFCLLWSKNSVNLHYIQTYYKKAIKYAWPLILNSLLGLGVTNFGKIYAFNYMSSDEMYIFSYTMRISLVIGMAHTSIVAFYSKKIYTNSFSFMIALKYVLFLLTSALVSFTIIFILNNLLPQKLPIDLTMFTIFAYNILFYAGSFCEAFYGRDNKNSDVLYISVVSFFVFAFLILIEKNMTILSISLIMLVYAFFRLSLMLLGIKDLRMFVRNKK